MSSNLAFSSSTSERYALALYELALEKSELEKTENEVKSLQELLIKSSDFKNMISNPTIGRQEQAKAVLKVSEYLNFSETIKKFLGFVTTKNRLFYLDKIIESFLNLTSNNKGELKASLISSKKLSIEEQDKIKNELSKDFKSQLNIDYEYDPNLIGGLIIQVGSIMVDTSIKTKLKKLEKNMVEA